MSDLHVRADAVNVEQIMEQIRARVREKRGVDYTEEQIRELATVKLEKFLDPRSVRSDLLQQFQRAQREQDPPLNYTFEENTLFESHRAPIVERIRRLLQPVLKLFFNPNPLIRALHIQSKINARQDLQFELLHNLVVEMTRLGIEVKNLKMSVESLTGRLEFNERRARALEGMVMYRPEREPDPEPRPVVRQQPSMPPREMRMPPPAPPSAEAPAPSAAPTPAPSSPASPEGPGQRSRRRRRRRGRRGGMPAAAVMGATPDAAAVAGTPPNSEPADDNGADDREDSGDEGPNEPEDSGSQ